MQTLFGSGCFSISPLKLSGDPPHFENYYAKVNVRYNKRKKKHKLYNSYLIECTTGRSLLTLKGLSKLMNKSMLLTITTKCTDSILFQGSILAIKKY